MKRYLHRKVYSFFIIIPNPTKNYKFFMENKRENKKGDTTGVVSLPQSLFYGKVEVSLGIIVGDVLHDFGEDIHIQRELAVFHPAAQ